MHFGQMLVKLFSQTRKLENSTSFEPTFFNPKTSNSNPKEAHKLKPEGIQTQSTSSEKQSASTNCFSATL